MWSFLGFWMVPADVTPDGDKSPYLSEDAIDPLWLEETRRNGKNSAA